ncbi:hypothetical protein GCM10010172_31490 [Paractinoplanes ferrugineus]|uniref:Uncharacterized protein n=1 Tax=Paractinoplanes ferrugineus TaxID=113564 RepID=A0A919J5V7_9ACTN|nr:hypothetical protein [Actinoplanes ferrugineus]GIE14159.1 hypothetical protein Afe05nite_59990 [Actinoplanes ferrugineus]
MTDIAVLAALVAAPLSGVVMFWLGLRFLWRVYKSGGAADLAQAADSLLLARGIRPNSECRIAPRGTELRGGQERAGHRQDAAVNEVQAPGPPTQADLG